jgi:hypothetical protein
MVGGGVVRPPAGDDAHVVVSFPAGQVPPSVVPPQIPALTVPRSVVSPAFAEETSRSFPFSGVPKSKM